jgi:hypothetical protein
MFPRVSFPEFRFPEPRFPESRCPESHFPELRFPESHITDLRFPESHFPESRFPESGFPESHIPESAQQKMVLEMPILANLKCQSWFTSQINKLFTSPALLLNFFFISTQIFIWIFHHPAINKNYAYQTHK